MAILSLIRISYIFCKYRLDELFDPLANKILLSLLFFLFLEEYFIGPPSGESPISSGLRCKRKKFGKNPITHTVVPIMIHPIRHPSKLIAAYAIKGIAVSPTICTRVAIETACGRRRTNQLLIALYIPRSNGPAKFMRAIQNNK